MGSQSYEPTYAGEPIAIVGSSCRFPGDASSPAKLWELLQTPRDVVSEVPASRFNTTGLYHADSQHHGSTNVRHAYLLGEDPRVFDRDFFGISPKEAESMDPQQRMLLETVYEGIESAGYSVQQLRGSSTAVFVGVMFLDYQAVSVRGLESLPQYHATGVAMSILANRLSYFYDWRGPSVAVDTACSSSLVALHQAVQTLRAGDADMAVAAGSNLILGAEPFVSESSLNMLSPHGRSYMWDEAADGYTRGEGFSAVILKTLRRALADGDHIECVIRETGVNQDGRTPGITMPSATAQAALIRATYARAGLDPRRARDRPQYFEAHGTGTQAGDPREAEAIASVFFPPGGHDGELVVGSIKTIIGHLEGSAGLAGVLKASLALQNAQIPANLHFKTLNPKIRPFYAHLRVPTETQPWPALPDGGPRRASVNSFGFGGTNAHAILESWHDHETADAAPGGRLFVLSANSAQSLAARAAHLGRYLEAHPETDLGRLARTLFLRADFAFRAAFSATGAPQLAAKLGASAAALVKTPRTTAVPASLPPRILGVFTGQGAQWATMGAGLYESSAVFRAALMRMQESLDSLPDREDRPTWSLAGELRAPASASRVAEAAVSQPLCTALQVALVDVLRAAGVRFAAVVGHSSGEIAAAYAAGHVDAHDAIRIAYLRGLHSRLARGPDGRRGKMMAVGLSLDQATAFCGAYGGALQVAASNSSRSCTLTGDAPAIDAARAALDAAGTFARVLQVDTAYHSHHMRPAAQPYLDALGRCGIKIHDGLGDGCPWYSSVWGANGRSRSFADPAEAAALRGQYWVDNLTNTVLFSQAVQRAVGEAHVFDVAVEVGPHPALKGPTSETITNMTGAGLPYAGVLRRGEPDAEALADALGLLWKAFPLQGGRALVGFDGVQRAFATGAKGHSRRPPAILKDLPAYPFDHDTVHWRESRASALFRTRSEPRHELLGHATVLGSGRRREVHWRQVLRLAEMAWLRGHRIQGEYLFPATAYVAMAYEAAVRLVPAAQPLRLVELYDVDIFRALNLEPESSGTEVLFTVRVTDQTDDAVTARWACYSAPVDVDHGHGLGHGLGDVPAPADAHAEGSVRLELGVPAPDVLPPRTEPALPLTPLDDMDELYETLAVLGHGYSDAFRAPAMLRRLHHAVVTLPPPPAGEGAARLTRPDLHPAALDTAIHGLLAAYSCPGDGRQRSVYLPGRIDSIRVSMAAGADALVTPADALVTPADAVQADALVTHADASLISGDLDVFAAGRTTVQVRGVHMAALPGSRRPDRELYAQEVWARDAQFGIEPGREARVSPDRLDVASLAARLALFYCRRLSAQIKPFETLLMSKNRKNLLDWVREHLVPRAQAGDHADTDQAWLDGPDVLDAAAEDVLDAEVDRLGAAGAPDVVLVRALGRSLASIARGLTPAIKVAEQDGALARFYADGVGFREVLADAAALVAQLSHRYPAMNMVEVGASFGPGLRDAVLAAVGTRRYSSYTVTNAVEPAERDDDRKLVFQLLDMDKDPVRQGFAEGAYDLAIAATSYSTSLRRETLAHARRLLRPGGFLVLVAATADRLPVRLVQSLLPGSWLERDGGAPQIVSVAACDGLLKEAGFSGVDAASTPSFCSVMLAQAVDPGVAALRHPASAVHHLGAEVLLVHDPSPSDAVTTLASRMAQKLAPLATVTTVSGLEAIRVPAGAVVLNLCDLDAPVFRGLDQRRFQGLQEVMRQAGALLWVTEGARAGTTPENTMVLGWARSARVERTTLRLQVLDLEQPAHTVDPALVLDLLLRLAAGREADGPTKPADGPAADSPDPSPEPGAQSERLWTLEPELVLRDNALYIPRVWPIDDLNALADTRSKDVTVEVAATSRSIVLDHRGRLAVGRSYQDAAPARSWEVLASSVHRLRLQGEQQAKRLCVLRDPASGETVLVLTRLQGAAVADTGLDVLWRHDPDADADADAARLASPSRQLHHLLAAALAEATLQGAEGRVWVHGAPAWLAGALDRVASRAGLELCQTTGHAGTGHAGTGHGHARFLHPFVTERELALAKPAGASTLICLDDTQHGDALVALVRRHWPAIGVERPDLSPESHEGVVARRLSQDMFARLVEELGGASTPTPAPPSGSVDSCIIPVQDTDKTALSSAPPAAVFDRTTASTVTATLLPPNHAGLFAADKTYLLLGLAGDLGIAIAHWLFDNGARHVVLASRNPVVPRSVVDHAAAAKGADLRVMAIDICSAASLSAAWADMRASMPPVAGVMHGAMVMRDRLFADQPWADFSAVLAPKVAGTQNLVALLDREAAPGQLDFVVFFSSAVAVAGNAGQTAYGAANWFMQGTASELRRRGPPACVVHIGHVSGLGYVHRHARRRIIEDALHVLMAAVSETDLLDMLAEAIVGGRPAGGRPAEIITGIRGDIRAYSWREQPRLWHYLRSDDDAAHAGRDGPDVSLKAQLAAAAADHDACLELLLKAFGAALCAMLHMKPDELDSNMPVASLGIDSLVAVRVREWFMHHVAVEVSVLKVMSANTALVDLAKDVLAVWRKQLEA
ncbi:hypothetical protein VD0001_g9598 [Verticillium dahliae]|nr:hypothetical protein VD0001_g9598 [Verticillium dahliae]